MKKIISLALAVLAVSACSQPKASLKEELQDIISDFKGDVGITLISGSDTVSINGNEHFPMFSVMKFHQALAVCDRLNTGLYDNAGATLKVGKADLKPDTWSPMRDEFPEGGDIPILNILHYSLAQSDNNACDILFKNIATPAQVDSFIHNLGVQDCKIVWTEDEQHADPLRAYENWTTPLEAAKLMGQFYATHHDNEFTEMVWETMVNCQTGKKRIPKFIKNDVNGIAHKTGTGGTLPDGRTMGINDVACILLPDGRHIELAVFIKDASAKPRACERLIAKIAKACYSRI